MTLSPYLAAHIIIKNYNGRNIMSRLDFRIQLRNHQHLLTTDLDGNTPPPLNKRISGNGTTNGTMLADRAKRMLRRLDDLGMIGRTEKTIIIKDIDRLKEYADKSTCEDCL